MSDVRGYRDGHRTHTTRDWRNPTAPEYNARTPGTMGFRTRAAELASGNIGLSLGQGGTNSYGMGNRSLSAQSARYVGQAAHRPAALPRPQPLGGVYSGPPSAGQSVQQFNSESRARQLHFARGGTQAQINTMQSFLQRGPQAQAAWNNFVSANVAQRSNAASAARYAGQGERLGARGVGGSFGAVRPNPWYSGTNSNRNVAPGATVPRVTSPQSPGGPTQANAPRPRRAGGSGTTRSM